MVDAKTESCRWSVDAGKIVCLLAVLVLSAANIANADRRGYVWTYEYQTMPKGESEVEYYLTTKVPNFHKYGDENIWEHQVEYEYGLTNRWDVGVYERWQQTNTSDKDSFDYTGTKVKTRYRFGEKGMYPIDTLLYLEYIHPDGSEEAELEGKVVLAKDFGKFNIAYNQIFETEINQSWQKSFLYEYAVGLNYEFSLRLKLGIESAGSYTKEEYFIGPTVSWASKKFWVGFGAQAGLNDKTDDFRCRLIIGFPF